MNSTSIMDRGSVVVAPIVIGFEPCTSTTNPSSQQGHAYIASSGEHAGAASAADASATVMASPLSRNASSGGRTGSSPGLLSLQLSLQPGSRGFDEYEDGSDFDSEDDYFEGEFALASGARGVARRPECYADVAARQGAASADDHLERNSQSQPISIPTTMWIKDPAACTACCLLQRERAIRRQQYEQSEAHAKQQYELQLRQQYYLQQQLQQQHLAQEQHGFYRQGHL